MKAFSFYNKPEHITDEEQFAILTLKNHIRNFGKLEISDSELLKLWIDWSNNRCPHAYPGVLYIFPWECSSDRLNEFMLYLSNSDTDELEE